MDKRKNYSKLVNLILDALAKLQMQRLCQIQGKIKDFSYKCSDMCKYRHMFYAAVEKNWIMSAEKIRQRISRDMSNFSYSFDQFKTFINTDVIKLPAFGDIYAELTQLEQEHGQFNYDPEKLSISIVTDPISFDDLSLGSFEIKLFIEDIAELFKDPPYRVIALEPNPAGSDDGVTHPHVSGERLCEGEGHTAINTAIQQGRLNDMFSMVINILNTYNPDSPYVSIADWDGYGCYDCGYTMSRDDSYYCEICNNDFCSHCSTYCQICEMTICLCCAYECPACNKPACRECISVCADCEETFCNDCINEEGICFNCSEIRKENENEEQQQEEVDTPCTAIQSYGMGQADIHA